MVDVYRYSDELLKRMPKENLTANGKNFNLLQRKSYFDKKTK